MDVFVLMGKIEYESSYLLGVYHTKEDAEAARDEYVKEDGDFDYYEIESRVIGARAKVQW